MRVVCVYVCVIHIHLSSPHHHFYDPKFELVLSVEEFLPVGLRRFFIVGSREVFPNRELSRWKRFRNYMWGGEKFDSSEKINNAIHPPLVSFIPTFRTFAGHLLKPHM